MEHLASKEIEDYLTSRLGGISVIDISIEYPEKKSAFHIEGEIDYYLYEEMDHTYRLVDSSGKEQLSSNEQPDFLAHVVKKIVDEEDSDPLL